MVRYWNTTNQDLIQLPDGYEESCGQSIVEGWEDMTEVGVYNAVLSTLYDPLGARTAHDAQQSHKSVFRLNFV